MLRRGKGTTDDDHCILLEGDYRGEENHEDAIYYLEKHLNTAFGISLYEFVEGGYGQEWLAKKLAQNKQKLWPWSKTSMSWKLR